MYIEIDKKNETLINKIFPVVVGALGLIKKGNQQQINAIHSAPISYRKAKNSSITKSPYFCEEICLFKFYFLNSRVLFNEVETTKSPAIGLVINYEPALDYKTNAS